MDRRLSAGTGRLRRCISLVPLAALALSTLPAAGQTGPDLLLKEFRRDDQFELNLDARFGFDTDTNAVNAVGDPYRFRADIYTASGRLRLTPGQRDEGIARAQPRAGFGVEFIDVDSNAPFIPDEIIDGGVGIGMGILAYDGWLGGVTVGVGYASATSGGGTGLFDDPLDSDVFDDLDPFDTALFDDANGLYLEANFAVGKTFSNGVDSFGLVINYDGNRSILPDWPLPGFQYRKSLDDEFILSVGFPYSGLQWRPNERLTVEVQYSIPDTFTGQIDYDLVAGVGLFGSFRRSTVAAHWDALDRGQDRVFFRQNLAEAGLAWDFDRDRLQFIVAAGYAFGQEFETGWDSRDLKTIAEIDDQLYIRGGFQLRL